MTVKFDYEALTWALDMRRHRHDRADALEAAFLWATTPQGYDFWHDEYKRLRDTGFMSSEAVNFLSKELLGDDPHGRNA
jgi:hypothetical protein